MITHQMKLAVGPFEKIAKNDKIIESRLYDEKRQQIAIGDQIEFVCNDNPAIKTLTKVKALYRYGLFEELFSDFPPRYFGGDTKENLIKEIETFYTKEDQRTYGVLGIKLELVK